MFPNWTVVTAGLGATNFVDAARRVESQAILGGFENVVRVTAEDLDSFCPIIKSTYPEIFNVDIPGFGFWAYKPESLLNELKKGAGLKRGVIWVDSGCELNLNWFTRIRMRWYMLVARFQGAVVFALRTPEHQFTKKKVLNLFPRLATSDSGNQIQATWFMLFGERGTHIASRWLEIMIADKSYFDDTFDRFEEQAEFIDSRHDQSIFSLLCNDEGIIPMLLPPPSGIGGARSRFRAYFFPIWASRNRSGESVIYRHAKE